MDLYFQGWAWLNRGITLENDAQAQRFFERALLLDPCCVQALVGAALVDLRTVYNLHRTARLATAETAALKALSLAPNHALANLVMGAVQIFTNRVAQGIAQCERALALDRNLASAHYTIGTAKYFIGRGEETEGHIKEALRLSPHDVWAHMWMISAGVAKLWNGSDAEAAVWLRRSIETNRTQALGHFYLAAALAQLGELQEARAAAQAGLFRTLQSVVIAPAQLATIQRTLRGVSGPMRACGWPGCLRAEDRSWPWGYQYPTHWITEVVTSASAGLVGTVKFEGRIEELVETIPVSALPSNPQHEALPQVVDPNAAMILSSLRLI